MRTWKIGGNCILKSGVFDIYESNNGEFQMNKMEASYRNLGSYEYLPPVCCHYVMQAIEGLLTSDLTENM